MNSPSYIKEAQDRLTWGNYNLLADNGDLYIICGDNDIKKWYAYKYISPNVEDKKNFYKMLYEAKSTGEVSASFTTKEELTIALEKGNAEFTNWRDSPHAYHASKIIKNANGG